MEAIYKMDLDCGRMGNLNSVFVAEEAVVDVLLSERICVYFGEVLGKHSEIFGVIGPGEVTRVTSDQTIVELIKENALSSGFNPLHQGYLPSRTSIEGISEDVIQDYEDVFSLIEEVLKIRANA